MVRTVIASVLVLLLVGVEGASAWVPTREQLNERRWSDLRLRKTKCLNTWQPKPIADVTNLGRAWVWWTADKRRVKTKANRCLPTTSAGIIRYVFPTATEDAAVSVAYCESRLYRFAQNASSGAAGLFQLMPFHWRGRFNPFNAWANTNYAYRLSNAGYDWGAWVCKP